MLIANSKSVASMRKDLKLRRDGFRFLFMTRILVFFIILTSFFLGSHSSARATSFKDLKMTGAARVAQIIDPQTLQLDDGRIVALVGLDMPYIHGRSEDGVSKLALLTIKILKDLLEGERVRVYQTRDDVGRLNRMGHHLAHVERVADKQWVQGILLSLGVARARTTVRNREMAVAMYKIERLARAEKIGLWEGERYAILSEETAEGVRDQFVIIEGVVQGTALKQNRIYLNFGGNWRTDMTVSIPSPARRLFSKSVIDPMQWGGEKLRVRGWIEQYNGPYIEVDHPERIEVLGEGLPEPTEGSKLHHTSNN